MRLLRTGPDFHVQLQPPTQRPPRYAILSHTWGPDEISFGVVGNINTSLALGGVQKCKRACRRVLSERISHVWIDTCCIDKTNSTELSEAINSMYRYYSESEVGYAYLSDVPDDDNITHRNSSFRNSRWFRRGWTLQELLAPKEVRFFSANWQPLGTRKELKSLISSITRIPEEVLAGEESCQPPTRSLAEVLSWASRRETTLVEDGAYSLLGLLEINMPLLYGEGERAFLRLQEELLKRYDNESLFAWEAPPNDALAKPYHGLLSPSLRYFEASHRFRHPTIKTRLKDQCNPRLLTSQGISLSFPRLGVDEPNGLYFAMLDCMVQGTHDGHVQPAILIQHLDANHYARVDVHHLHSVGFDQAMSSLAQFEGNCSMVFPSQPMPPKPVEGFMISKETDSTRGGRLKFGRVWVVDYDPPNRWFSTGPNSNHLLLSLSPADVSLAPATGASRVNPTGTTTFQHFKTEDGNEIPRTTVNVCIDLDIRKGHYPGAIERVLPWAFLVSHEPNMTAASAFQCLSSRLLAERPRNLQPNMNSGHDGWVGVGANERQFPGNVFYEGVFRRGHALGSNFIKNWKFKST